MSVGGMIVFLSFDLNKNFFDRKLSLIKFPLSWMGLSDFT